MWDKFKNEITLGALLIVFFVVIAYLLIKIGAVHTIKNPKHIKALFEHASGIVKDASVMVAGVPVGQVTKLEVAENKALLYLDITGEVGVRKDAKAMIRSKSLLGEKYVEIVLKSNTTPPIENGDLITDTSIPFEIDQLVTALAPLLRGLNQTELEGISKALSNLVSGVNRLAEHISQKSPEEQKQIAESVIKAIELFPSLIVNLNTFAEKGVKLSSKVENIERKDIVDLLRKEGVLVRMKEQ